MGIKQPKTFFGSIQTPEGHPTGSIALLIKKPQGEITVKTWMAVNF